MTNLNEDILEGLRIYGNLTEATQYAYEIEYYRAYKQLPEDKVILDKVEEWNGCLVIIHMPHISLPRSN